MPPAQRAHQVAACRHRFIETEWGESLAAAAGQRGSALLTGGEAARFYRYRELLWEGHLAGLLACTQCPKELETLTAGQLICPWAGSLHSLSPSSEVNSVTFLAIFLGELANGSQSVIPYHLGTR